MTSPTSSARFAGTVPLPRKREVDPWHERPPTPPTPPLSMLVTNAPISVELTVVAQLTWHCDGDLNFPMSTQELDDSDDTRVVYTYPGGRIQLVEVRFTRATHWEVTACWVKRVVLNASGGPDFKWASFTQNEYDRLAGKGLVDRWAVVRVGCEIMDDDDFRH